MIKITDIEVAGRTFGIHFNGEYFLDDGNNVFLQRHPETLNWFIMVRHGYDHDNQVEEINERINQSDKCDYCFSAAWTEYQILLMEIITQFHGFHKEQYNRTIHG